MTYSTNNFSILIQGKYSEKTNDVLRQFREAFPNAEIILSVWQSCIIKDNTQYADKIIASVDPGATQIIDKNNKVIHTDNSIRQFISFYEAYKVAKNPFIIKWRSDALFNGVKLKRLLFSKDIIDNLQNGRILVSTFLSLDASICKDWSGHISDWFYISKKENFKVPSSKTLEKVLNTRLGKLKNDDLLSLNFFGFPISNFSAEQLMTDLVFNEGNKYFNSKKINNDFSEKFIFVYPQLLDLRVRDKYTSLTKIRNKIKLLPDFNGFSISEGLFIMVSSKKDLTFNVERKKINKFFYPIRLLSYKFFLLLKIIKSRWLK